MSYYNHQRPMPEQLTQHSPVAAWEADSWMNNPCFDPSVVEKRFTDKTRELGKEIPLFKNYIDKNWTLPVDAQGGFADAFGNFTGKALHDIGGMVNSVGNFKNPYMEQQLVANFEERVANGQDKFSAYDDANFDAYTDPANIFSIPGLNSLKVAKGIVGVAKRSIKSPKLIKLQKRC